MQATVNLATETALVRAAMSDEPEGHAERLEGLGKELAQVCLIVSHTSLSAALPAGTPTHCALFPKHVSVITATIFLLQSAHCL